MLVFSYIHWYLVFKAYITIVSLAVLKIFEASLNKNKLHISTLFLTAGKKCFFLNPPILNISSSYRTTCGCKTEFNGNLCFRRKLSFGKCFLCVWDEMKGICDKRCPEIIRLGTVKNSMVQAFPRLPSILWAMNRFKAHLKKIEL